MKVFKIGVDASNLRRGGGRTHLIEFLSNIDPDKHQCDEIIVWGSKETLDLIPNKNFITKINPKYLNKRLIFRIIWQYYFLSIEAKHYNCSVLFVPGGNYIGRFKPTVTMCRNMLPFENKELFRYKASIMTIKLLILRYLQTYSFRRTQGLIFLTEYAEKIIKTNFRVTKNTTVIPHGVNSTFRSKPKSQFNITAFDENNTFNILYISIIDMYKHQWNVIEAIHDLRKVQNWPLRLILIGPKYEKAYKKLLRAIDKYDPYQKWVKYEGNIEYGKLNEYYKKSDLGIFASSCENMPNILIEKMSSGLPIASSNKGPMMEILKDSGVYFDPDNVGSIKSALEKLIKDLNLRESMAYQSYSQSKIYDWKNTTSETIQFLKKIHYENIK